MTNFCACNSPWVRRKDAPDAFGTNGKLAKNESSLLNGRLDALESVGVDENASCLRGTENLVSDNALTANDQFRQNVAELKTYYIGHNTLHGLHYIFDTKSILRKLFWFGILLTGAGLFFNEVKISLTQYYKYPFRTQTTVEYPSKISLPAVSICDFRDIRPSLISRFGRNFQMSDIQTKGLDQLQDHLISCVLLKGVRYFQSCDASNFTVFLSSAGQICYTLNSGQKGYPLLEVDNVGPMYGLRIIVNTQQLLPGRSNLKGKGLRVILHEHGEMPLKRVGFHASPGYVTYVDLRKRKVRRSSLEFIFRSIIERSFYRFYCRFCLVLNI